MFVKVRVYLLVFSRLRGQRRLNGEDTEQMYS